MLLTTHAPHHIEGTARKAKAEGAKSVLLGGGSFGHSLLGTCGSPMWLRLGVVDDSRGKTNSGAIFTCSKLNIPGPSVVPAAKLYL
eukprot:7381892-Pyramimonas_sp.AAC.1